jgi:hypothetical protein
LSRLLAIKGDMKHLQVRLWLIALVCVAAGITSRIVLETAAPPYSRYTAWQQCELEVFWYFAALLLFLAHIWRLGTSGLPEGERPGCIGAVLWVVLAVLGFLIAVISALPSD